MGVYIKGMEMPRTHPLTITIYPNGQVLSETVGAKDIHGDAVPVPPHGRLIDADALLNDKGVGTQIAGWGKMYHETAIEYAPTIIPVEQAEEGE